MKARFPLFLFLFSLTFSAFSQVGIKSDNSSPDPSAGLDVQFSDRGALIPRMTMAQRDSIVNPANGLMVICTDCGADGTLNLYLNGSWKAVQFTTIVPASPTAGTHVATQTQITWNWNSVTSATGYKWNTANDYNTATDMGTSTSKTQAGLTCNTPYSSYVWAYNSYGHSAATALVQTTSACSFVCGNTITVNHVAGSVAPVSKTVAYGTVTNIPGEPLKCWITSNLGASQQATAVNDATEASAGWYWQFNRKQGYKHDGTTRTPGTSWIGNISENIDWLSSNDPCNIEFSSSWRVPTSTEWTNVDAGGNWTNWNGPWSSNLKLHASGYLLNSNGMLDYRGIGGFYWSNTQVSSQIDWGFDMYFNSTLSSLYTANKSYGFTIRCINDCSPSSPASSTHTTSQTQVTWNWNTVTGATGYKWSTTNNYSAATDMGTATYKTETGLTCNTAYTRYVWAYNSCGYSAATTLTQNTSACPWVCGQPITDIRDSKTYPTVLIGTQCWLAKNLNVGTRINGSQSQANNSTIEKYCYNDLETNCDVYGGLYQWDEYMNYTASTNSNPSGRQGICPVGWHVPSDAEWCQVETYLDATVNCSGTGWRGTDAGGKMKETGTTHWADPNMGATNSSGFTALPGGNKGGGSIFFNLSINGYFWSSMENTTTNAWYRDIAYINAGVDRNNNTKVLGLSGRCVKD